MSIVLRAGLSIGTMSAEEDHAFLSKCFVDTGQLEALTDQGRPECIVLGRTGSGKSALLLEIENTQSNVIRIDPEDLSLNYITNSDIIANLEKLGINLDVFYQLLWRHVLAVEIIRAKKQLSDEVKSRNWLYALKEKFAGNAKKAQTLEYLERFGSSFWITTEERIKEVVNQIENVVKTGLGGSAGLGDLAKVVLDQSNSSSNKRQETIEFKSRAQKVVNTIQLQHLNQIIDLIADDIFDDANERFYIVIDDLDRGWADDQVRFKLIRALVETIKKFRKVHNLKIIVGMRVDLLETVFLKTRTAGFQTEKYEDLFLRVRWSQAQLQEVADRRINLLYKSQYTKDGVGYPEVFVSKVGDTPSFQYILDRTLYRPRDVISYVNQCFLEAAGQTSISARTIRNAESTYSQRRYISVADEWREMYGPLERALALLGKMPPRFEFSDIDKAKLEEFCLGMLTSAEDTEGKLCNSVCVALLEGSGSPAPVANEWLAAMYVVGAVGVKLTSGSPYEWSFRNEPLLQVDRLTKTTKLAIHPMFHKALNVYADPKSLVN